MPTSTDRERAIELSRGKLVLMIAGSLLLLAGGAWFVVADGDGSFFETTRRFVPDWVVRAVGAAGVLFFGYTTVFGVRKSFDRKPGLVLTPAGMVDNASAVAAGFIPWSEVTGLGVFEMGQQRMLVVHVADTEKYIAKGNALKRSMNRANAGMCGSPVVISANALRISFDELQREVAAYASRYAGPGDEARAGEIPAGS